tara:strand:+ start:181 stop:657 length:477 start_codon:yes stop_codon:yes gene_type:complete
MLNNNVDCCVICLEDEDVGSEHTALPIDSINELEKTCICKYSVHTNCIRDWIQKNPVCVICADPLYYIESNLHRPIPEGTIKYSEYIHRNQINANQINANQINANQINGNRINANNIDEDQIDEDYIDYNGQLTQSSFCWCVLLLSTIVLTIIIYCTV